MFSKFFTWIYVQENKHYFQKDCYEGATTCRISLSIKHTIELMNELVLEYKEVLTNADLIIDLLELVLANSLLVFHKQYFQQIFDITMGINVAPILANLYLATLEKKFERKNQK